MPQTDPFSGQPTYLQGPRLPGAEGWAAVLDGHRQRLRALDLLVEAAGQCGLRADQDRDFVLLAEDEVSLLEPTGGEWAAFGDALRRFSALLPILPLETFGFSTEVDDPFEANTARLRRIGGGVEALAFATADLSVYKFFLFREGGAVGAAFQFLPAEGDAVHAVAVPGTYRLLFEKQRIIHEIGMPTEIVGITPEGFVIAKQTFGRALPAGANVSDFDPQRLIPMPSRFLRADRDHPRLYFLEGVPWLVADTHDRNVVTAEDGSQRAIDLVAAPLPPEWLERVTLFRAWIERARCDPRAAALAPAHDDEL
ncbi:MAG: hypothetical protein HY302_01580 [Opitutae bacterium]|nr:hypothetical protein [Opitutae bacterium]